MNRLLVMTVLASTLVGVVQAQWLNHPSPGIPRRSDGKPDLDAPAPRTSENKPDFSGIWQAVPLRPCPPQGCGDMPSSEQFHDIGWNVEGGLPLRPWAAEQVATTRRTNRVNDPLSHCKPVGLVRHYTFPDFRKIIQTRWQLAILNALNGSYREIHTDGRPLPVDPNPTWNGYSTGRWEGDVLVVTTTGFRDDLWLDNAGAPLTSAGTLTERFRRRTVGSLEIELTVDDPKAYTRPWTTTIRQRLVPDTELLDYICVENEKSREHFVP